MRQKVVLVTGATGGIGLAFTKAYLGQGYRVVISGRNEEKLNLIKEELKNESNSDFIKLDVTNDSQIDSVFQFIQSNFGYLDILINNAGVNSKRMGNPETTKLLGNLNRTNLLEMFNINSVSPIVLSQKLLPLIKEGEDKLVINISSDRASLALKMDGSNYGYCASKISLNMLSKIFANDVKSHNIRVANIHPGWVKTDMGGDEAVLTPEESVRSITNFINNLSIKDTGKFFDYQGNLMPN